MLMFQPLKDYAKFDGRSRRAEYWQFLLFYVIAGFVLGGVDGVIGAGGTLSGLFALGMLIPMATSTNNIVLLGDQMQLSQPVEGVHPGHSGDSVLDYLLQGE
ncbi:MAG: DUF805 domain-containing protein, partial [Elsteraceae bacterium]